MNNFTSTLDLPNLSGFDKGVPTTSAISKYFLLKWFLIICFIIGVIHYFSIKTSNDKEIDNSEKMKSIK